MRGTLVTGTTPKATAVTASDLKDSTSVSPFAAMNAGIDPASADCLCLRPGNPALHGRGALGRSRHTSSGSPARAAILGTGAENMAAPATQTPQQMVGAEALAAGLGSGRLFEPAPLALRSREDDTDAPLSLASERGSSRISGMAMFGGAMTAAGGYSAASQANSNLPLSAAAQTESDAGSDSLSAGFIDQADGPDSGAIRMAVTTDGGVGQIDRQWLARLTNASEGFTAGQQEMMSNAVRFFAAVAKDSAYHTASSGDGGDAGSQGASTMSASAGSSASAYEPELGRQITSTLSSFGSARTSAPAWTKADELTLLQTTASGSDVFISLSAPGNTAGSDPLFVAALDDSAGVTAAAVPEPSNFAMAAVAALLLAVGSIGTRKAS